MSSAQKTIKYVAIAFAIFLIVGIFSAIASLGLGIFKAFGAISDSTVSKMDHSKYSSYIDINLKFSNLKLVRSNYLKVDNSNDKVNVKIDNNKLEITDSSSLFSSNKDKELIVYVPSDYMFEMVYINSGAGKINIEGFNTKELKMDLGAGEAIVSNVISNKTDIDTGTGRVDIHNSKLNDAKFDLGIGSISIGDEITGNCKINSGIGRVELNLSGSEEDYSFDIDKGIGDISLNNRSLSDGTKTGNGRNSIEIDGGIGSIDIKTK